jgi:phosphate/sulfate permease
MIGRALAVWLGILLLANLNGAIREAWLIPALGQTAGRAVSTLVLSALVLLIAWLVIAWIAPTSPEDALLVGVLWLALTLAFEFLVGHYVFHKPWAELTQDYDVTRGRIWPLVLVMVLLAPLWAARLRRLW